MIRQALAATALAAAISLPVSAQQSPSVEIHQPFAWISPAGASGAAYARIYNPSGSDDRIVAVSTTNARRAELHTHSLGTDGVARMHRLEEGIPLPAGQSVDLAPGGMHIMLMGLHKPPAPGEFLDLILEMESGGETRLRVEVVQRGIRGGMHGRTMDHMDGMAPTEGMDHMDHQPGAGHGAGHMRFEYE